MIESNLTAPTDAVLVSRRETFRRAYEAYRDDNSPDPMTGFTVSAQLIGPAGRTLLTLSEGQGITRTGHKFIVEVSAAQMALLALGTYRISVLATSSGYVDELLVIEMTVTNQASGSAVNQANSVTLQKLDNTVVLMNAKSASVAYMQDLVSRAESAVASLDGNVFVVVSETEDFVQLGAGGGASVTETEDYITLTITP